MRCTGPGGRCSGPAEPGRGGRWTGPLEDPQLAMALGCVAARDRPGGCRWFEDRDQREDRCGEPGGGDGSVVL